MNSNNNNASNNDIAVLCHCSAGIGRTGVFLSIVLMVEHITATQQYNKQHNNNYTEIHNNHNSTPLSVSVCSLVKELRQCRSGMVQSKQQYIFIYQYLLYCIQHKLFGIDVV